MEKGENTQPTAELAVLRSRINELEKAEFDHRHAEMEKEAILQSLVEHVVYHDKEMKILWANRAACESVGMSGQHVNRWGCP